MVAFNGICRTLSRLAKGTAPRRCKERAAGSRTGVKGQAVSDGELNMSVRGCGGNSSSTPRTLGAEATQANSVLSWAVSFEKLLEDPTGVRYFTAFLKSEVSAENILFWQACEAFRKIPATCMEKLKEEAHSIYQIYLAESAPNAVNIDDMAKTEEKDLQQPTLNMFDKAQTQIFKLMKLDSYRRFVRSPLYQSCTLASVEGRKLPGLFSQPVLMDSWEDMVTKRPSFSNGMKAKKSDSDDSPGVEKRWRKRGSWGEIDMSIPAASTLQKGSHMPIKSTSSVELGSLYRQTESGHSSPRSPEQGRVGASRLGVEGGYCCVYLPDGSASLAPTRSGVSLKEMLTGLCEKRCFPLKDVVIYLHGKDKQPLSLEQDCSVLRDQQVSLELRLTFSLEVVFTGKTVGIMAKSSKTLQDALTVVLQKHQLKPQDTLVTMMGSDEPLSMSTSVYKLASKRLQLHKIKDKDPNHSSKGDAATQGRALVQSTSQVDRVHGRPSKNRDMDGLLELLTRAQCCRVEDQRGLLTKEHLEVPLFLQLPSDRDEPTATSPDSPRSAGDLEDVSSPISCPADQDPKSLKETSL